MGRHVVLLRAVNVGGHNKVPMAALRQALDAAGCTEVKTLLASGNVVFSGADGRLAAAELVHQVISRTFGLEIDCLGLGEAELRLSVSENSLWDPSYDGSRMLTMFCDQEPEVVDVPRKELPRLNGDTLVVGTAGELHVVHQWCEDGISNTPAMQEFVRFPKGSVFTGRNRNTLVKLLDLI